MGRVKKWLTENKKKIFLKIFNSSAKEFLVFKKEIEQAREDWRQAQNYFKNVTDPDLIDHAVFMLDAAEAKYIYLLKKAKNNHLLRGLLDNINY